MPSQDDFDITHLGPCRLPSPLRNRKQVGFCDDSRILYQSRLQAGDETLSGLSFEEAGPRQHIFFDPAQTTAAIVTCGGLSPGLNNVIRSAFLELHHNYQVQRVLGIRNGFQGLNPSAGLLPVELTCEFVEPIHNFGGTILGSSRGPQEAAVVTQFLIDHKIDILFCIGGDGTQRGAHQIAEELQRQGLPKAVVGIPKTIDNDINYVFTSFGYNTALEKAAEVINAAHVEARGAPNGIGLVKLMGRHAGFIAAGAAVASQDANFVLVPEVRFPLDGSGGFLDALLQRIKRRGHALVVVAEGAGQDLFSEKDEVRDLSGNLKSLDIGTFLIDHIKAFFQTHGVPINLKYLDPSYLIRSIPANASDRILCDWMARYAVHAGMTGKTDVMIGFWNHDLIHVPIGTAIAEDRKLPLDSDLWGAVLGSTGQPSW